MFKSIVLLVVVVVVGSACVHGADKVCNRYPDFKQMATKTDYDLVANIGNYDEFSVPNCEILGFWHLSRHGHRFPSPETVAELNENLVNIQDALIKSKKSTLCDADRIAIEQWKPTLNKEDAHQVTPLGQKRMAALGRRYARRLQGFLEKLRPEEIHIQATYKNRTQDSAKAYLSGMFENLKIERPRIQLGEAQDFLLGFYEVCDKYIKTVTGNANACPEIDYFEDKAKIFDDAKDSVRDMLNIPDVGLKRKRVWKNVLQQCQFEYITDQSLSPWCKLINGLSQQANEMVEDLDYNCNAGYKYDITRQMTCDLVKDLVQKLSVLQDNSMKGFESTESSKKLTVYLGHSDTIVPFMTTLGLYETGDEFRASKITKLSEDREWKTSNIDPMGSNIAFVTYKCNDEQNKDKSADQYRLRVFHNERLVKVDGCDKKHCDLNEFLGFYFKKIAKCRSSRVACL